MSGPSPREPREPSAPSVESVYDAYLEAALAGAVAEPEDFLQAYPGVTGAERDELLERLAAIGELARPVMAEPGEGGELGEFKLLRRLGGGAMGDVHLAEQTALGRLVALKTQRADLAASPRALARFEREAQALAQIAHPSVVGIIGCGSLPGEGGVDLRYLAMELVPGRSLKELLDQPRPGEAAPSPVQIARWGVELAEGLAAVHAAGLLHRDVKPSNVRIREDGRAVLVDFGLARSSTESELSRTGEFIGSPAYAAPEQIQGVSDLDERADVYGLGATLYHALAGRPPFNGESVDAVLHAVLHRDPAPLRTANPNLPRDLELVTAKAMEKARDQRYPTAKAFAADLLAVLELRPVRAKPVGLVGRTLRWARRNRLAAASLVLAAGTVLSALVAIGWQVRSDHRARLALAADHVTGARETLAAYAAERRALLDEEADYDLLYKLQEYQHLSAEDLDRMRALEDRVRAARERRDDAYRTVGNLLDQALVLDPNLNTQVNAVWSELLVERVVEAEDRSDLATRDVFMAELERRDPGGALRAGTYPFARVQLTSAAPGAEAWLFRLVNLEELPGSIQPTEAREVPVPLAADELPSSASFGFAPPVPWGGQVLRVAEDAPGFAVGDLILDVAGRGLEGGPLVLEPAPDLGLATGDRLLRVNGLALRDRWDLELTLVELVDEELVFEFDTAEGLRTLEVGVLDEDAKFPGFDAVLGDLEDLAALGGLSASVYSGQGVRQEVLPADLALRPTAAPLFLDPQWSLPLGQEVRVAPGRYVAVVRAPGRELERVFLEAGKEATYEVRLDPTPVGFAPPGFVRIASANDAQRPFFIAETEVTSAAYLAYLNEPAVLAAVDAARAEEADRIHPRSAYDEGDWGMWSRDEDGRFFLEDDWPESWPVLGVSWEDAVDYCTWLTENDPRGGRYRLPIPNEFYIAGAGVYARRFAWGERFDQRFANTCFTRRIARPAPVRTHLQDESPFGVYDMSGNAYEWLDTWWDESRELRPAGGGAWGQARISEVGVTGQRGLGAERSWGESGMRLVWEPGDAE